MDRRRKPTYSPRIKMRDKTDLDARDSRGRFKPGHRIPGPGRPPGSTQEIKAEFLSAFTLNDVQTIARDLKRLARAGSIRAAQLLLERLLGPVTKEEMVQKAGHPDDRFL